MTTIAQLQPQLLWDSFYKLTQIPRPSGHLAQITLFLTQWAQAHGINCKKDDAGNLIWSKPATPGMEGLKTVTLQAHMDMVPQKTKESTHNFETDPIQTYIDGDWVKAKETTLGADDGIGVATIMALMIDPKVKHGPLEALITVDEETTMYGVNHLEAGYLEGTILLNLDNETEGEMVVGSAGGINLTAEMQYKAAPNEATDTVLNIHVKGLLGGHSGLQINEGRANANQLMVRIVNALISTYEARLISWHGGNMRNAIPREAEVLLALPQENIEAAIEEVNLWKDTFIAEWGSVEQTLEVSASTAPTQAHYVPEEIQDAIINALHGVHNGVLRFIPEFPSIVETSSNMAVVEISPETAKVLFLLRSSQETQLDFLSDTLTSTLSLAGFKIALSGYYPAWQPRFDAPIVHLMENVYQQLFDQPCQVKVVHAGLECGLIGNVYPKMDMVSFGPTLRSPHTPQERCHIPSVARYYDFIVATLAQIPAK